MELLLLLSCVFVSVVVDVASDGIHNPVHSCTSGNTGSTYFGDGNNGDDENCEGIIMLSSAVDAIDDSIRCISSPVA